MRKPVTHTQAALFLLLIVTLPNYRWAQENQNLSLSPRLKVLQKQIDDGDHSALEKFWDEMAKQGAPLIELIARDDKHALVTGFV